jgi:signal transduction histidine kinase
VRPDGVQSPAGERDGERAGSERADALADRAAALVAERDRAAAADERARIARELHDIIAHHISVVALQTGTARMLAESGQCPDVDLLRSAETASRQEVRASLPVTEAELSGDLDRRQSADTRDVSAGAVP